MPPFTSLSLKRRHKGYIIYRRNAVAVYRQKGGRNEKKSFLPPFCDGLQLIAAYRVLFIQICIVSEPIKEAVRCS